MWPIAYAIVRTVKPNANETPSNPIPTLGKAAESTALPQPPRTSQNVPISSAVSRLLSGMTRLLLLAFFAASGAPCRGWMRHQVIVGPTEAAPPANSDFLSHE